MACVSLLTLCIISCFSIHVNCFMEHIQGSAFKPVHKMLSFPRISACVCRQSLGIVNVFGRLSWSRVTEVKDTCTSLLWEGRGRVFPGKYDKDCWTGKTGTTVIISEGTMLAYPGHTSGCWWHAHNPVKTDPMCAMVYAIQNISITIRLLELMPEFFFFVIFSSTTS